MQKFKKELSYKDVSLLPQFCIVKSRQECDTTVKLGNFTFVMPVYPSNMKSVVDENTCKFLASKNWFYTMHRFGINPVDFTNSMHNDGLISSISIGIKPDSFKHIEELSHLETPPEFVTIDVANAWSEQVKILIKTIKSLLPNTFLIVGNIATNEAANDLEQWGADAIKVGIAGGHSCITKNKTGFYRPMISTILDCSSVKIPIIADGGISEHGDVAKALSCEATMIMAGSLFAGFDESAGDIIEINDRKYKEYFGSASEYNKEQRKNIEGKKILIDYKGSMSRLLQELQEDLQSSISYAGGNNLSALHLGLLIQVNN
jgi:GMP reductase